MLVSLPIAKDAGAHKNCFLYCRNIPPGFSSECLPLAFPPQQVPFFQLQNKVLLPGLYSPLCPTTLQGLENHYPSSFGPFILLHSAATGTLIGSGMPDVSLEKRQKQLLVCFFWNFGKMLRFSVLLACRFVFICFLVGFLRFYLLM